MKPKDVIQLTITGVKRRIAMIDAATGMMVLAAYVILFLLVEVVCDHLFILSQDLRAALFSVFKLTSLVMFLGLVVVPVLRRVSDLYVARKIEETFPTLNGCLSSLLDAQDSPHVSREMLEVLRKKTAESVAAVRPERVIPTRRFRIAAGLLIAAMVASSLYAGFSRENTITSAKRSLLPGRDIPPPTRTVIVAITPGRDAPPRLQNTSVKIAAKLKGERPSEVFLNWSWDGEKWFRKRMKEPVPNMWVGRVADVGNGIRYFVRANGTESEVHKLVVVSAPIITGVKVRYLYPAAIEKQPLEVDAGHIEAPKGTQVLLDIATNNPIQKAKLVMENGEEHPVHIERDGVTLKSGLVVERNGHYHIDLVDVFGNANVDPVRYDVVCLPSPPRYVAKQTIPGAKGTAAVSPGEKSGSAAGGHEKSAVSEKLMQMAKADSKTWKKLEECLKRSPTQSGPEREKDRFGAGAGTSNAPGRSSGQGKGNLDQPVGVPHQPSPGTGTAENMTPTTQTGSANESASPGKGSAPAVGAPTGRGMIQKDDVPDMGELLRRIEALGAELAGKGDASSLLQETGMSLGELKAFLAKYDRILAQTRPAAGQPNGEKRPSSTIRDTKAGAADQAIARPASVTLHAQDRGRALTGVKWREATVAPAYRELVAEYFRAISE